MPSSSHRREPADRLRLAAVLALSLGGATLFWAPVMHAQASPEVVARLQRLLQEANQARALLEREKIQLEREVAGLEKQVKGLEKAKQGLERDLERSENESAVLTRTTENLEQRYTTLRQGYDKLLGGCTETVYLMRDIERERNLFVERLADSNAQFGACAEANSRLLALNEEILERYEKDGRGGLFKSAAKREPFTQLSRKRLENAIDDYRHDAGDEVVMVPDDLPLVDDGGRLTIDGRWECYLVEGASSAP